MPATPRRTLRPALVLALLLVPPTTAAGQEGPPAAIGARAFVDAGVRLSSLRSTRVSLLGGSVGFDLGSGPRFGAGGWILTDPVELTTGRSGSGVHLRLAYGGVLSEWPLLRTRRVDAAAGLLVGVGNAKLELAAVGAEIASDNFAVVEPGVVVDLRVASWLGLVGGLSWRWVGGVEDLPGVDGEHLEGVSGTLGLRLGPG